MMIKCDLSGSNWDMSQMTTNTQFVRRRLNKIMTLQIPFRNQETELFFPMQLKQMTDEETKEYHLKKLYELSKKSLVKSHN